jgi:hypothetical protein
MRGSGLGAAVDMLLTGDGPLVPDELVGWAHAAIDNTATVNARDTDGAVVDRASERRH